MSREIKFRAYYLNKDERFVHDKKYCEWSADDEGCNLSYVITSPDYIVVQYTGLKDKNGVEIWEGDVLAWEDEDYGHMKEKVEFFFGRFGVTSLASRMPSVHVTSEVIGNIYENPELLEQKS